MIKLGRREFVFATCVLAAFAIACAIMFQQANLQRERIQAAIAAEQETLSRLHQTTQEMDTFKARLTQAEQSLVTFESSLPKRSKLSAVTDQIAKLAEDGSLATQDVHAMAGTDANSPEQQIDVTVQGEFDHVYGFLLQLEKQLQPMRVESVQVDRLPDHPGQATAHIRMSILVQSEPARVANAPMEGAVP